ncbi:MAG TPA: sigma-70 family RNA polymerase sigma factor [Gaiellaceae bacterium]|nr:sigma-70 family RNA polymerase sigma factor [Gaiellaceae bacterium]
MFEIADHAFASVLERLDDFTDDRHFGTWALKFALREATVRLQTRAWRGRELPAEPDPQTYCSSVGSEPEASPEQRELLSALPAAIADALTPEQRHVLGALALNGVPIDVLAERLESNRGAVYETLRDARQRLRTHLGRRGPTVP